MKSYADLLNRWKCWYKIKHEKALKDKIVYPFGLHYYITYIFEHYCVGDFNFNLKLHRGLTVWNVKFQFMIARYSVSVYAWFPVFICYISGEQSLILHTVERILFWVL